MRGLNRKGSSLPLTVFGILLFVVACVIAYMNVGATRDQINAGDSINQVFYDFFVRYGAAIVLGIIGSVAIGLGLRR